MGVILDYFAKPGTSTDAPHSNIDNPRELSFHLVFSARYLRPAGSQFTNSENLS
jgi:hypothetical protein